MALYQDPENRGSCKICYAHIPQLCHLKTFLTSWTTPACWECHCPGREGVLYYSPCQGQTPSFLNCPSPSPPPTSSPTSTLPYAPLYTRFAKRDGLPSLPSLIGSAWSGAFLPPRLYQDMSTHRGCKWRCRNHPCPNFHDRHCPMQKQTWHFSEDPSKFTDEFQTSTMMSFNLT